MISNIPVVNLGELYGRPFEIGPKTWQQLPPTGRPQLLPPMAGGVVEMRPPTTAVDLGNPSVTEPSDPFKAGRYQLEQIGEIPTFEDYGRTVGALVIANSVMPRRQVRLERSVEALRVGRVVKREVRQPGGLSIPADLAVPASLKTLYRRRINQAERECRDCGLDYGEMIEPISRTLSVLEDDENKAKLEAGQRVDVDLARGSVLAIRFQRANSRFQQVSQLDPTDISPIETVELRRARRNSNGTATVVAGERPVKVTPQALRAAEAFGFIDQRFIDPKLESVFSVLSRLATPLTARL